TVAQGTDTSEPLVKNPATSYSRCASTWSAVSNKRDEPHCLVSSCKYHIAVESARTSASGRSRTRSAIVSNAADVFRERFLFENGTFSTPSRGRHREAAATLLWEQFGVSRAPGSPGDARSRLSGKSDESAAIACP